MATKNKLKGKDLEIKSYYDLGFSDSKISKIFNVGSESIRNWRIKNKLGAIARIPAGLGNLKFSNIKKEAFMELYEKGFNDPKIAKELNESPYTIFRYRTTLGLAPVEKFNQITLTDFQKQVFIGQLLGDGNLHISPDCKNASGKIEQSIKQKDYFLWKFNQLNILTNNKITESCRENTIEGRVVPTNGIQCYLPAHPFLTEYYYKAYKNNIKTLNKDILKDFGEVSLAVMFMDDGCKYNNGYSICTNGFDLESINEFKNMLFYRFNLHSIHSKKHQIHILREEDARRFEEIVGKYIIPSMEYKLHQNPYQNQIK
jgi:hypothetical protein